MFLYNINNNVDKYLYSYLDTNVSKKVDHNKCCWGVRELRRQIKTNLYFRVGISKNPELLLQK